MTDETLFLQAMSDIRDRLDQHNRSEIACGLPTLQDADMTWVERYLELERRVIVVGTMAHTPALLDRMDDMLDAVAAHVVAFKLAIRTAQETRIESGEAA